ncbi:MAG: hypothetical protein OXC15_04220 [Rhodospirillaceae bacterium]|nr:hypothetical protein [Rhodospirillaceae bacterium]
MSVLTVRGRRFAAGLYWLERGGAASVARNARAFKRPWHIHWGGQTGYAAVEESPKDCPSLAASLQAHIAVPTWMALVESDDGRLALVKARDGAFLADGDEVFSKRASAVDAFERSRGASGSSPGPGSSPVGWALYATPGLADRGGGEVTEIDPASLADDPAMRLAAAPLSRLGLPNVGRFLALAAVLAGAAFVWMEREALWTLIAGPEEVAEAEQVPVDPPVRAVLDTGALVAGCRQALMAYPPYMPAWRTERVSCEGRFGDLALIGVRPELEDRAVLTVRWRLGSGRPEPLHRRIAETHLSEWYAASVSGDRAWAAIPLAPVLRRSDAEGDHSAAAPSLLEFREAVDRHFGARAARIEYPAHAEGIEVRISTGRVPFGLADAVAAVPGLELVRLTRDSTGEWLLEGRRAAPVSMPRERFEQLTRSAARPLTGSAAGPEGPAGAEITGSIDGAPAGTTGAALNRTDGNGGSGS